MFRGFNGRPASWLRETPETPKPRGQVLTRAFSHQAIQIKATDVSSRTLSVQHLIKTVGIE
ncbi:hypothetical protein, partial [Thiocapsa sp. C4-3m]|uniref:hypothetical protein n=1 Tax=Thiocapsa sp. C4-3m TaxID=3137393 RepID=UPI0035B20788